MLKLFIVLSSPLRMHDGAFVVLSGSVTGVKAHEFPTKGEADDYFRLLRLSSTNSGSSFAPYQ